MYKNKSLNHSREEGTPLLGTFPMMEKPIK
jgi:hypothetical protein